MYNASECSIAVSTDCSIREYQYIFHGNKLHSLNYPPNMLSLCWHSTPTYYTFYYAGIFEVGLSISIYVKLCSLGSSGFREVSRFPLKPSLEIASHKILPHVSYINSIRAHFFRHSMNRQDTYEAIVV